LPNTMNNLYKQKRQEGFTIIEVLIVLAIAAVILLIVFLAVPALQRNSRNNGVRNDAANLLAGVNDYISNNNGNLPTAASNTAPTISITGTGTATEAKVRGGTDVQFSTGGCNSFAPPLGTVIIYTKCKCNTNATGNVDAARAISALFSTETTSSNTAIQCIES
jgi:prepilin-type N-terminal cleavage/methylation domain-containing protein